MNLIYIQIIICASIMTHSPSYTHKILSTHCPSWSILLVCPLLGIIGFCFLLSIHCLARCWYFYLNAFVLSRIMIANKGMMAVHAWQLQRWGWQTCWIGFMCLWSYSLSSCPLLWLFLSFPPHIFCNVLHWGRLVCFCNTISHEMTLVEF